MRIGLLQLNATIGAFDKNRARLEAAGLIRARLGQTLEARDLFLANMEFFAAIDQLISNTERRRKDALAEVEFYREAVAIRLRRNAEAADAAMIEGNAVETEIHSPSSELTTAHGTRAAAAYPNGPDGAVTPRHASLANFVFCDGHAKSMRLETLLTKSTTPPTWGTWASDTNNAGLRYFTRAAD